MNKYKKKKVALVGGAGFIGHNLALYLNDKNLNVQIFDHLGINNLTSFIGSPNESRTLYWNFINERINLLNKKKIKLSFCDARNYNELSLSLDKFKPDIIIHLAAVSHSNVSNKDPHSTFDHSLRTLENSLDISRSLNCHLIYLSSSMVYGNFEKLSVNENDLCKPIGIYGTLKYCGELLIKSYNQIFDLDYTIIRPSALYGERCVSRRVGQIFLEQVLNDKDITINGSGEEKLDFTYINDLCQGIYLSIINKNAINNTFNITFGQGRKINDLVKILSKKFKTKVKYKNKEKFTPKRGTLNISKAKKLLGYKPQYPIEIGYNAYIDWYSKVFNNYKI